MTGEFFKPPRQAKVVYSTSDGLELKTTRYEAIDIDISDYEYLMFGAFSIGLVDGPIQTPYFQIGLNTSSDFASELQSIFNVRTVYSAYELWRYYSALPKLINVSLFDSLTIIIPAFTYSTGLSGAKIYPYVYNVYKPEPVDLPQDKKILLASQQLTNSLASGGTYTIPDIDVSDISKIQVQLVAETPADDSGFKVHLQTHYDKLVSNAYTSNSYFSITPSSINDFYTEILNQTTSTILDYTNIVDVGPMNSVDVVVENLTSGSSKINVAVIGELE